MNRSVDTSKARSLVKTKDTNDRNEIRPLDKIEEDINQTIDVVDTYKRQIMDMTPPCVKDEPWYKFSFGKADVENVNEALKSFTSIVKETFKLVAVSQNLQNENTINICKLIGVLAIVEASAYEEIENITSVLTTLTKEDEKDAEHLKKLEEKFHQSLEDSASDSRKKEEQLSTLIEYVACFAESKTKKIRSISLELILHKSRLDEVEQQLRNSVTTEQLSALDQRSQELKNSTSMQFSAIRVENAVEFGDVRLEIQKNKDEAIQEFNALNQSLSSLDTKTTDALDEANKRLDAFIERSINDFENVRREVQEGKKNAEDQLVAQEQRLKGLIKLSSEQLAEMQDRKNAVEIDKVRGDIQESRDEAAQKYNILNQSISSLGAETKESILRTSDQVAAVREEVSYKIENVHREIDDSHKETVQQLLAQEQRLMGLIQFTNNQLEASQNALAAYQKKAKYILYALGTSAIAAIIIAILSFVL